MINKIYLLSLALLLFSCKKEIIYPSDQYPIEKDTSISKPGISIWGEFLIIDAIMYVDNHETSERLVYNHFGVNKSRSSFRWGGSRFNIEEIIKDTTTYSFWSPLGYPGYGDFVLNNDTSQHYAVYYVGKNMSIVEDPLNSQSLLGGSARPFSGQTDDYANNIIGIQIGEMEGSINGYNCRYWTQLKLKKIKAC
jgi:hypothetical protein